MAGKIIARTAGVIEAEKALDICRQMYLCTDDNNLLKVNIFWNARYATDISIHLQWKSNAGDESVLGRELSSELESLGLISHTVWNQEELNIGNSTSPENLTQ
jgi:hypothetical protein